MATAKKKSLGDAKALMLAKLETSCLDEADAKVLRLAVAKAGELKAMGFPDKMAFELPYFDAKGRPSKFSRWRYLEDSRDGFAAKTDAKAMRYVQTPGTLQEIYMPPTVNWEVIQKDKNEAIGITEGELKAACATKHLLPTLGLGGVYSFKSTKRGLPLLPVFYDFEWKERRVYVMFDSDASSNPMVVAARNELCRELLGLGALPRVVHLTPGAEGEKRGVDDAILQDGAEYVADLLEESDGFAQSMTLHELNTEVAYVRNPGLVVNMDSGQKMSPDAFSGHAYANRYYYDEHFDKEGNRKFVKKPAAKAWVGWEHRLELSRMVYSPGEGKITAGREFNTWPGWGCEPKRGSVEPWRRLLDHLFQGHPEERLWFERWCALPLQRPGAKLYTAAVLWGVATGTGKSLVGYTLGRIYGLNFTEICDVELQDERNEWAVDKQFVMGDDVTGAEQRRFADRLKKMITQKEMRIDQKYVPTYTVQDRINYLFTSNHPDAFFLEDDDRRFFIHEVDVAPLPKEFYAGYMEWLDSDGPAHLFDHLLRLDLGGREPEDRSPVTAARNAMVEDGLSDVGRWVRRLRDDPDAVLKVGAAKLAGDLWSAGDLLRVYDPDGKGRVAAGGLSRELKRAGFRQVYGGMPVRTSNGQARLFAVREREKWHNVKSCTAIVEHYEASRSLPNKKAGGKF